MPMKTLTITCNSYYLKTEDILSMIKIVYSKRKQRHDNK